MDSQTSLTVNIEAATKISGLGRDHIWQFVRSRKLSNIGCNSRIRVPRTAS
jgi:hypothetical protein